MFAMKTTLICFACAVGITVTLATPSWAQQEDDKVMRTAESESQGEDDAEDEGFARMPPPLDSITGNLLDLEKTGHLRIISGSHSRTKMFDDQAIVWTVEVIKPLTCGLAILLLKEISDVRFYQNDEDYRRERFNTRLFYESWLDVGAVSHEILDRDERFDIWIDLTDAEAWRLTHENTNEVVFGRPIVQHYVDPSIGRWK
jgi:hypothetical protein